MKNMKLTREKWAAVLSGWAFLLLITPAWKQGFLGCAAAMAVMAVLIARLPVSEARIRDLMTRQSAVTAALVICSALGVNFFHTWRDSGAVASLAGKLGLGPGTLVIFAACALVVLSVPASACVLGWYGEYARRDFAARRTPHAPGRLSMGASAAVLFAVYALGIAAILRANIYYKDDLGRAFWGYKQWDYFSRYVSTAMSTFVHMSDYLADASPLPQLLAALLMALAGTVLAYGVLERTEFTLWEIAALVLLGLNPYFLECFSYRFDGPYMAVSVLIAVTPILFRRAGSWAYILAAMFGSLLVCAGYQSATGVFPMAVIFVTLRLALSGEDRKKVFTFVGQSVAGYGLGLVFFRVVIMRPASGGYVSNSMPGVKDLLPTAAGNLAGFYRLVVTDFKLLWLALAGLILVIFVWRAVSGAKIRKAAAAGLTLAALSLGILLAFGIYPFLAVMMMEPRAMYGFGVLLTLLALGAAEGEGSIARKLPVLVLAWAFITFAFTYGNALQAQQRYTDIREQALVADLNDLEVMTSGHEVQLQLRGNIGYAPVIRNMPRDGNMLERLMPPRFGGGIEWAAYRFYYYWNMPGLVWDDEVQLQPSELTLLEDNMYHTIYGDDSHLLVVLK